MSDTTQTLRADGATAPVLPPAAARWLAGAALVSATAVLAVLLTRATDGLPHVLPGYARWQDEAYASVPQFLRWWIGDATEAQFYKSAPGGICMIAGGWLAHTAARRGRRWAGFPLACGSGLWPWLLYSAVLGLLLSDLAWGWTIPATGRWQPTFVPFVSVPPAVVLVYGAGWSVAVTGAVLGAALATPAALVVTNFFCQPLHLPNVIGCVTGMWAGALLAFLVCRHLPWMPRPLPAARTGEPPAAVPGRDEFGAGWVVRRVLADFTEAQFYGNELASAGLIGATLAAYLLNPLTPVYGSTLLPALLTAQVLAGTLGVLLYHRRWVAAGWYPTFVPVVSLAPAVVLTYGGTVQAVVAGAVGGAVAGPPLAALISRRLPADFHPFIGNVASMAVCTLVGVPLLGLLPGFVSTL
jgi:hypothetical protein